MSLTNDLKELKDFKCEDGKCILSLYLNTDRSNKDQQKGEWKIRLKNGLKKLEEYLTASGNEEEIKSYKKVRQKVEKEILGNQSQLHKSVVIFASANQNLWLVNYLNMPVDTSFHWEETPVLDQLMHLRETYPTSGIILPSQDEIKVFHTDFGEVIDTKVYSFEPDTADWRPKDGVASSDRTSSSANHVDSYDRRIEENLNRFYKETAVNIERMNQEFRWEAVYLVGDTETTRSLQSQLRLKIKGSINKNLNNSDSSKVLEEVFN